MSEKTDNTAYMTELSEKEKAYAVSFADEIDVTDRTKILHYGDEARKKVVQFSESSLVKIPANDLNEVDQDIRKLMKKLREFQKEFDRTDDISANDEKAVRKFKSIYDVFSAAMSECGRRLEIHRSSLIRHMNKMDQCTETLFRIIREYDMYIYAGKHCLAVNAKQIQDELNRQAAEKQIAEYTMKAEDFRESCAAFDRRLGDLSFSRSIPLQMTAQLKMMRNTDAAMADNLLTLYSDTFPLYRSRILLSLGLQESSDEKGKIIDADLFHEANSDLMKTLSAILKIQTEGVEKQKSGLHLFERK